MHLEVCWPEHHCVHSPVVLVAFSPSSTSFSLVLSHSYLSPLARSLLQPTLSTASVSGSCQLLTSSLTLHAPWILMVCVTEWRGRGAEKRASERKEEEKSEEGDSSCFHSLLFVVQAMHSHCQVTTTTAITTPTQTTKMASQRRRS